MKKCLGCHNNPCDPKHYLCRGCWFELPAITRARLRQRDADARNRLFQLYRAIYAGKRLAEIQVAA